MSVYKVAKKITVIGLVVAMNTLYLPPAVAADPTPTPSPTNESVKQLEAQREQITSKEDEIKALEKKINELKGKRDTTAADAELIAAQVQRLASQLQKAELELKQITTSISLTSKEQDKTENAVEDLTARLAQKRQQLKSLVQALYAEEQQSFVRIFFDSLSLSDVLAQRAAYKELQDRTIEIVLAMRQESDELKEKEQQLEQQFQQLQTLEQTLAVQQGEINAKKKEQQVFLQAKKEEQLKYEQKIAEVEAAKEEIKRQVFTLKDSGVNLTLTNAFDMARFAGKLTGVRPALLLAVLKVESNLGANVGSGHYPDDMHPGSRDAFVRITKKLGLDPTTAPVSRKPRSGSGWGGAMGPAQIMPATWESIEPRLAQLLNKTVPNPYELTDAFVATAIFLADRGAASGQEYEAVNKYIAGPYWQYHTWYGDRVLAIAAEYQKQGL